MTTTAEVDPLTAKRWLDAGEAVLVDVREPALRAELIAGARSLPDPRDVAALARSPRQRLVLYCEIGARSAHVGERLAAAGVAEVYNLAGGIQAWKGAGLPVGLNPDAPRVSVLRQVQMVAGALVLTGAVLAALVSPWFLLLAGGIGAGLLVSGATGTCAMAMMLARLPFNRARRAA
jgi:rhodanese-related sulfurtransferase